MDECEVSFQELKKHLGQVPILSKSKNNEPPQLYLAVTSNPISLLLGREEGSYQLLIYYVGKALLAAETHYLDMEKLVFSLVIASRKLSPYFVAYTKQVLTNFQLSKCFKNLTFREE